MRRRLGIVHRKDSYLSPAAMRFVLLVSEMGDALMEPPGLTSQAYTSLPKE